MLKISECTAGANTDTWQHSHDWTTLITMEENQNIIAKKQ